VLLPPTATRSEVLGQETPKNCAAAASPPMTCPVHSDPAAGEAPARSKAKAAANADAHLPTWGAYPLLTQQCSR
jgi:hypothetical protein